jgi:hypothetical protein
LLTSQHVIVTRREPAKRLGEHSRHLERDVERVELELADVKRQLERAVAFILNNDTDVSVLAPVKERRRRWSGTGSGSSRWRSSPSACRASTR